MSTSLDIVRTNKNLVFFKCQQWPEGKGYCIDKDGDEDNESVNGDDGDEIVENRGREGSGRWL